MSRRSGLAALAVLAGVVLLGFGLNSHAEVGLESNEYVIFQHHDVLGNAVVATDADGEVLWYEQTEPFGKSRGRLTATGQQHGPDPFHEDAGRSRLGFTGHVRDGASGLIYMQARHYDPELGRFLSSDPVGFSARNPISFNRYAYANNNPYKYVDPDGRQAADAIDFGYSRSSAPRHQPISVFEIGNTPSPGQMAGAALGLGLLGVLSKSDNEKSEQLKKLTKRDIRDLIESGNHPHDLKDNSRQDLFKDRQGNVIVKPKSGIGPGDPTGINLNDLNGSSSSSSESSSSEPSDANSADTDETTDEQ